MAQGSKTAGAQRVELEQEMVTLVRPKNLSATES